MPRYYTFFQLLLSFVFASSGFAQSSPRFASLGVTYVGDTVSNLSGGLERKTTYLDNIILDLTLDLDGMLGWEGASAYLNGLGSQGGSPSSFVGDAQGVNNIEAPNTWKLYESWIQQVLFEHRLSILAGLYDLNTEFDVIRTAGLFINSSHGIGVDYSQSGQNGPSIFPTTSLGIRMKYLPHDHIYLQGVILDAVSGNPDNPRGTQVILNKDEGVLIGTEAGIFFGGEEEWDPASATESRLTRQQRISRHEAPAYNGKLAIGGWVYSVPMDVFDSILSPPETATSWGIYGLAEWAFIHERRGEEKELAFFVRLGGAQKRVNRFGFYLGTGLTYTGLFPGRSTDQFGFAVATARNGDSYRQFFLTQNNLQLEASEVNLEATYLAALNNWISIQADFQYVINPDTNPSIKNALLSTLRFQATF